MNGKLIHKQATNRQEAISRSADIHALESLMLDEGSSCGGELPSSGGASMGEINQNPS